ncbi:MAG: hypothetical protein ACRDSN_01115, partial [Pseudonocardiaceae bacterium]
MAEPTRPEEIGHSVGLADLVGHAERHAAALSMHRLGIAHLSDADRAGHAVAELAYTAALSDRALSGRWVMACEALDAGAGLEQVTAAMGLDADELPAGLRSWARGQLRHGLIDDARHAEVLTLLGEQPPAADPMDHLPTWQLRRLVALLDALGDPPLTVAERASLLITARQDHATVDTLAAVIRRARREAAHPGD